MLMTQLADSLRADSPKTPDTRQHNDPETSAAFGPHNDGYTHATVAPLDQNNYLYTTLGCDSKCDHAFSTLASINQSGYIHETTASVVSSNGHKSLPTHTTTLSTGEIWRCLQENATLSLTNIEFLTISYFQAGSEKRRTNGTMCTVQIKAPRHYVNVKLVEQTCTSRFPVDPLKRLPVWVNDSMYDNYVDLQVRFNTKTATDHWTGCESVLDPLFTIIQMLSDVTVVFTVRNVSVDYRMRINITSVPFGAIPELDLHFISPLL
ncbi:hypothetical protein BaRGS_00005817, partial [Batillaria attramentaria]